MDEAEDIFSDFLRLLDEGEAPRLESDVIRYGPLVLTTAAKAGKANTLMADHLFSPSILLAEVIERGLIPLANRKVVELGAGCALPSLLASTLREPPALIVATDYPDASILANLRANVERNWAAARCPIRWEGYEWGKDATHLLTGSQTTDEPSVLLPATCEDAKFDVVILSDLLHFDAQAHDALVRSLELLLCRKPDARAYLSVAQYTAAAHCDAFMRKAGRAGITFEAQKHRQVQGLRSGDGANPVDDDRDVWMGTLPVSLGRQALAARKAVCRWWIGRWDM